MIKDIKYNGYTAVPSDYECGDGELAGSYNMTPENGAMHPVLPPTELFTVPQYHTLKFLHHTSAYKHYILYNANLECIAWIDADDDNHALHTIPAGQFTATEIYKVDAVGNTLLLLTPNGMFYMLWKGGTIGYLALGYKPPELDLEFSLDSASSYESEEYKVETGEGPRTWSAIIGDAEVKYRLETAMAAAANTAVAKAGEAHTFCFPFFVRYAYRLYDGTSLTMHSAPILMITTTAVKPTLTTTWASTSGSGAQTTYTGPATIKAAITGYNLKYIADYAVATYLQDFWADIITGVDVYISPMFYTYDQGKGARVNTLSLYSKDIKKEIVDNANFFLLKKINLEDLYYGSTPDTPYIPIVERRSYVTPPSTGVINVDFVVNNDNIVVREQLTDDYDSHDRLIPKYSQGFNARLNLAGLSKKLFNGFSPKCLFFQVGNSNTLATEYKVVINENDKDIVVAHSTSAVNVTYDSAGRVLWFYYPNPNAKVVYVKTGNDVQALTLKRHSYLHGAYYLGLDETVVTGETMPDTTTGDAATVILKNKLYTSEANNPFFFPLEGIKSVGTGEILSICAAAKALSQGQFGQFPLYAFTDEGIWALETTSTGSFKPSQPFTEDVCENTDSITQLDGNVVFATDRGIMMLSGSKCQCISDDLFSDSPFTFDNLFATETAKQQFMTFLANNGYSTSGLTQVPFSTFLAGCRIIYDYVHQRIIIYNTGKDYAYIYSLKDHKWGMMATDIDYGINSYPDALAVTDSNKVVNLCKDRTVDVIPAVAPATEPTTTPVKVKGIIVTRPLKLDQPDALKTIDTVIQRGKFDFLKSGRTPKPIRTILYGSRDLYNWFMISSSTDHYLRGFSGTPYKYFRIVLLCDMLADESVYGATIQYKPRYLNRPR